MPNQHSEEEKALLDEVNRYLLKNVDWKEGARKYLRNLVNHNPSAEIYHLIKPFIGGPDFTTFFDETYRFLNMLEKLNLEMNRYILDVGTGPGWVAHYLAKLGHRVIGIDISSELLRIAEKRVKSDPFPPYNGKSFEIEFLVHDIEERHVNAKGLFDVAIFEATLHHFFDPIAALKNVRLSMKEEGFIVILEGAAPCPGDPWDKKNSEIMEKYNTLERPFTRQQLSKLLDLSGFQFHCFYASINGFFDLSSNTANEIIDLISKADSYNYVIASQNESALRRINKSNVSLLKDTSYTYQTDSEFIKGQYMKILGRMPDQEGLKYYLSKMHHNQLGRSELVNVLKSSEEYKCKYRSKT